MRGKESVRRANTMPGGQDNQHAEPRAKIMRDDVEDRRVAAMGVQKNQLAAPGTMDAFAKFCPGSDEGLGRKTEGAGKIRVLDRKPAILHGQEQNGEFIRHAWDNLGDIAFHDESIGAKWQMRAMLLGRGDRQDGDGPREVTSLEIGPGHFDPKFCFRHEASFLPSAAYLPPRRKARL